MTKIKSTDELLQLRKELSARLAALPADAEDDHLIRIRVAMATCGIASGAREVMEYLVQELEKRNITAVVSKVGCMGYCYAEPTIEVTLPGQEPVVYGEVDLRKADIIIEKYIKNGEQVDGIIPLNYNTIDN